MIVDTSVLFDALVDAPLSAKAVALIGGDQLFAPDHLRVEIIGALTRAVRRGEITAEFARRIYAELPAFMPNLEPSEALADRSFALSLELTHPFYDCLFLALAELKDDRLVTADMKFARKLATTPYARHVVFLAEWEPNAV